MSHLDDSSLELYALARVPEFEAVSIEEHLLVCSVCDARFQSVAEFALAARDAALVIATELIATHRTDDGVVHLYVRRSGVESWVATIRGEALGGGVAATTRQDAVELCFRSFHEMFPEHACNGSCKKT